MSRTYDIVCRECKVGLWIGQSHGKPENGEYRIYGGDRTKHLADFLYGHLGHHLEFNEDQLITIDYEELTDDEDDEIPEGKIRVVLGPKNTDEGPMAVHGMPIRFVPSKK